MQLNGVNLTTVSLYTSLNINFFLLTLQIGLIQVDQGMMREF